MKSKNEQASPMSFTRFVDQNFTYNYLNLPTHVNEYDGGGNYYYYYDEQGNRVEKKFVDGNGNTISDEYYLRDQSGKEVAIYKNGGTTLQSINLYGNGLLGYIEKPSGNRFYYVKDHLGSIRQVIHRTGEYDTSDKIVASKNYYPYGIILKAYNNATEDRYDFTEKERDKETNFNYFGARYYDSFIGRWNTVDPLADKRPGLSPYQYAQNNPLNRVDPTGMLDQDEGDEPPGQSIQNGIMQEQNYFNELKGLSLEVANEVKSDTKKLLHGATNVIDGSSDAADLVALAGIIAAPFTDFTSLAVTTDALSVSAALDITSAALKRIDVAVFDGSTDAFNDQLIEVGINVGTGYLLNSATSKFVVRSGLSNSLFKSPTTKRFVKHSFGYTAEAVRDATKISIGLGL